MRLTVEKEKYRVVMILDNMKVTGDIHIMPNSRLTDVLNSNQIREFVPVTNAEIEVYSTGLKRVVGLIEINRNSINAIYPEEEQI